MKLTMIQKYTEREIIVNLDGYYPEIQKDNCRFLIKPA